MINNVIKTIPITVSLAAGGAVYAAIDHDAILAWVGASVAIGGAVLTLIVQGYHKIRSARREENLLDGAAQLVATAKLAERTEAVEAALTRLEEHVRRVGCRFPNPDGTARCTPKPDAPKES